MRSCTLAHHESWNFIIATLTGPVKHLTVFMSPDVESGRDQNLNVLGILLSRRRSSPSEQRSNGFSAGAERARILHPDPPLLSATSPTSTPSQHACEQHQAVRPNKEKSVAPVLAQLKTAFRRHVGLAGWLSSTTTRATSESPPPRNCANWPQHLPKVSLGGGRVGAVRSTPGIVGRLVRRGPTRRQLRGRLPPV